MDAPFALIREMQDVPDIIRNFRPACIASWLDVLHSKQKILLTGEGSSRIFPAHNLIHQALLRGHHWQFHTTGARQAYDYPLADWVAIGASNSGKTRELITLFKHLTIPRFAVTGTADSRITELADQSIVLSCGPEQAVAATKSVIEQALIYQALLQGDEWQNQNQAADLCQAILSETINSTITETLSSASCLYMAGRDDGVAEELTLKAYEISRLRSIYLEGTYVFHGVEEIMTPQDALILIEPSHHDFEKIQSVIIDGIGTPVIAVSVHETPFPTIRIPQLPGFDSYFQLLAGWKLLVSIGLANHIDLDRTKRARKMGNAI